MVNFPYSSDRRIIPPSSQDDPPPPHERIRDLFANFFGFYPPDSDRTLNLRQISVARAPSVPRQSPPNTDEKRALFAYTPEKLQEAVQCQNHTLISQVVDHIKNGNWSGLIEVYKLNRSPLLLMHNVLKAAFYFDKITIDELATAYFFLSPAIVNQSYEVVPFDQIADQAFKERFDLTSVPNNLKFCLRMAISEMNPKQQFLVQGLFDKDRGNLCAGACFDGRNVALASAALWRSDRLAKDHPPHFVLGLTPKRADMYQHMLDHKGSDIALIDPDQIDAILHGVKAEGLIPYIHDGFHTFKRAEGKTLHWTELLQLALRLEEFLDTLPAFSPGFVDYSNAYPRLSVQATVNDQARFVLDTASALIADGEVFVYGNISASGMIAKSLQDADQRLGMYSKLPITENRGRLAILNRFLNTIGEEFEVVGTTVSRVGKS